MPVPYAAIAGGLGIASAVKGLFGRKKSGPGFAHYERGLRAAQPQGYLNQADYDMADRTRNRIATSATQTGAHRIADASNRLRARGFANSPVGEATLARIEEGTAAGREHAGDVAAGQLDDVRMGRESFGQQKELEIFRAGTANARHEQALAQSREAAFFNSLVEFIPSIMGGIDPQSGVPTGDANANLAITGAPNLPGDVPGVRWDPATGTFH